MEEPDQSSGSNTGSAQAAHIGGNAVPGPSAQPEAPERTRGRKRTRTQVYLSPDRLVQHLTVLSLHPPLQQRLWWLTATPQHVRPRRLPE